MMEKKDPLVFIVIVFVHLTLQFLAWSFALGNTVFKQTNIIAKIAWPILSFPMFWILPGKFSDSYFWSVFLFNSICWAGVLICMRSMRTRRCP